MHCLTSVYSAIGVRGGAVVEKLRYKLEGRGDRFPMVSLE
jgi:hypothetical protein